MIYQSIKTAKRPDTDRFLGIAAELYDGGCDAVVLGCTELSLIPQTAEFEPYRFIDSLLVLARKSILECGKIPWRLSGYLYIYGPSFHFGNSDII